MAGPPSVLLVDDHPANLLALEVALEPLDVKCVRASSGFEALRQVLRNDFAAILLDVQMPDMDGLETAAIIKRRRRSRDVPIIFITGRERERATVARGYSLGAVDYLIKPYDGEVLRSKVRALVDLHRKDARLRESEARFRTAFEHAPIGIALLKPDGTWIDANRALGEMLGRPDEDLLGSPPFDLPRLVVGSQSRDYLGELIAGSRRSFTIERRLLSATGETVWTSISVSCVRDVLGEPLHLICQIADITEHKHSELSERRRAEQRVAYLAYHDELTGLANRAMFREHLDLALARASRHGSAIAVLYLDLNRFKLVNDSLGHAAGDELLRQAARRLAGAVRASDLVARVGGDEFIVLLSDLEPDAPLDVAELVASGIHEALSRPFEVSSAEFYIGASIGIALYVRDDMTEPARAETLLEQSDAAMFEAKQNGAPTAVYTGPAGEPRERLALITRLHKAIQQMDFALHWLPIIDLDTQTVCGMEALIRWHDPESGWRMPREFMPLVEESGMIDRVGLWTLGEAAARQVAWLEEGIEVDVSVNISARQLWRAGAVESMLGRIRSAGADPRHVVVELNEGRRGRASERIEDALAELRAAGVRVAIDDFAHSPLTALSRMELDVLKLGGPLVAAAERREGETMVRALVQLARALGIWPLAEHIENRGQYEILRDAGCRFGQGHFFSHALPAEHVPDFVRSFTLPVGYDPWVAWEASRLAAISVTA